MSKPLLSASSLHKSYVMGRSPLRVLSGASLSVAAAEFLVVMGASGSGKSTLLHLLGALDVPDSGTVGFRGRNLFSGGDDDRRLYRNKEVGFVFQFYHLLPECNVLENVLMPMMVGRSVWQWLADRKQARRDAEEILDRVGLADRLKHRPRELSGGERQRVAIARALVSRPALLLADEPTGNLDKATGLGVMKLLGELNRAGQTIVLVTHDHEVAARAHRCVQLTDGVLRDAAAETMPPQIATRTPRKEVAP